MTSAGRRVPCVGAVVRDGAGRLLLVRRGRDPGRDRWSLPGGRVEPGESAADAVVREVREETGLRVRPGAVVGRVDLPGPGGAVYEVADYACTVVGGELAPGDDADEVRWVADADVPALPVTDGLVRTLTEWGVLSVR